MIWKWSVGYETEWQKEIRLEVNLQECWGNKGTINRPETSSRIDNVKNLPVTYETSLQFFTHCCKASMNCKVEVMHEVVCLFA